MAVPREESNQALPSPEVAHSLPSADSNKFLDLLRVKKGPQMLLPGGAGGNRESGLPAQALWIAQRFRGNPHF